MCSPPTCSATCETYRIMEAWDDPHSVRRLVCASCLKVWRPKPQSTPKETK